MPRPRGLCKGGCGKPWVLKKHKLCRACARKLVYNRSASTLARRGAKPYTMKRQIGEVRVGRVLQERIQSLERKRARLLQALAEIDAALTETRTQLGKCAEAHAEKRAGISARIERARDMVYLYDERKETYEEIAVLYKVSKQRVEQIIKWARTNLGALEEVL